MRGERESARTCSSLVECFLSFLSLSLHLLEPGGVLPLFSLSQPARAWWSASRSDPCAAPPPPAERERERAERERERREREREREKRGEWDEQRGREESPSLFSLRSTQTDGWIQTSALLKREVENTEKRFPLPHSFPLPHRSPFTASSDTGQK